MSVLYTKVSLNSKQVKCYIHVCITYIHTKHGQLVSLSELKKTATCFHSLLLFYAKTSKGSIGTTSSKARAHTVEPLYNGHVGPVKPLYSRHLGITKSVLVYSGYNGEAFGPASLIQRKPPSKGHLFSETSE